jgi:uncharacterized LabA/DUF88 family protein
MKKVSVFIDGYNLYHAVCRLDKPHLKWVNPRVFCKFFIQQNSESIHRILFFTAPPIHKPDDVQRRYAAFITALKAHDIKIIEGKFKRKLVTYHHQGKEYTRPTHEEKESDVNLSLAILEDAYEKISDKLIVVTNDSDIAPAIRLARKKNQKLRISVVTPPLTSRKKANYDLADACGNINRNRKGQVYFKTPMIQEFMLEQSAMPATITLPDGGSIKIPSEYRRP